MISESKVSLTCASLDEDVAAPWDHPLADTTYPYVFPRRDLLASDHGSSLVPVSKPATA